MYKVPSTVFQSSYKSKTIESPITHLVNALPNTVVDGSVEVVSSAYGLGYVITVTRDPALDQLINCAALDSAGNDLRFHLTTSITGTWLNVSVTTGTLSTTLSITGTFITGIAANGLMTLTTSIHPADAFISFTNAVKHNWIKWSDIGYLSFTQGRDNVAGERPLDWAGWIYQVRKLNDKVIAYGQNGVSFLIPRGNAFGLNTIYRIGLKGKHAVAGDETKQFFIDNTGCMWKVSDSLKSLGYSEYLDSLNSSVVMSYDSSENLLYICDGVLGFVFDVEGESLGKGPVNITGIGYKSGTQYVTASSTISTDAFEICTDIFDLGVRAGKTIFSVELGTDLTAGLYVSVDWRRDKAGSFTQTPWYAVSAQGRATVIAYGREFRFRVKTASYEYFELDYIKINGVADAY